MDPFVRLPLKHGGETRPWCNLSGMFSSTAASHEVLVRELKTRKKEHLVAHIDVDLLNDVVAFLSVFPPLFDILEYANVPTMQNALHCIMLGNRTHMMQTTCQC